VKLTGRLVARGWRLAADARNRRFATRLSCRPDAPILVLSPHPDDAVLDCWSVLTADREVMAINVFAGMPPAGASSYWDRIAGFDDPQALSRARIVEDGEALALAGRSPSNLSFPQCQYRVARRPPSFDDLDAAIAEHAPSCSMVYAPANIGVYSSDHRLVREYARALSTQGLPVHLYADVPYAVEYGWPGWVTGEPADPHINVDAFWESDLTALGLAGPDATVVRLDEEQARAKLAAMRTYRTQFPTLDRGPIGRLSNPRVHSYELFWSL
jgi:LmbE family N-acetylglucosaminyl deacetylase